MKRLIISFLALLWCVALFGAIEDTFPVPQVTDEGDNCTMYFKILSEEEATVAVSGITLESEAHITVPSYVTEPENGKEYEVTGLDDYCFSMNTHLLGIRLPATLVKIGIDALWCCANLESVDFGGTIEIGESAFCDCISLRSLHLPDSLEKIGAGAFWLCTGLGAIFIPDKVTTIGENAFNWCEDAKVLVLGKSVDYIGRYAFIYHSFEKIYSFAQTPPENRCEINKYNHTEGYVPGESIGEYENDPAWSALSSWQTLPPVFAAFYQPKFSVEAGGEVELEYALFNAGNVEIESMRWEASDDGVVLLDDGIATGVTAGGITTVTLTITDMEGNDFQTRCQVEVMGSTGIDPVEGDSAASTEIFTVSGRRVSDKVEGLAPGVYILKSGKQTRKILVR